MRLLQVTLGRRRERSPQRLEDFAIFFIVYFCKCYVVLSLIFLQNFCTFISTTKSLRIGYLKQVDKDELWQQIQIDSYFSMIAPVVYPRFFTKMTAVLKQLEIKLFYYHSIIQVKNL